MCDCGCNTCETKSTLMLNESLAPRDILSEGLKYHMDANKPLTEHLYRAGSNSYFNLWAEARSLYSRNILEITHEDDLAVLTETDLGHFGMFEGKKVPLDFPIELNEQMDIYDEIANEQYNTFFQRTLENGMNVFSFVVEEELKMCESYKQKLYLKKEDEFNKSFNRYLSHPIAQNLKFESEANVFYLENFIKID